MTNLKSIPTRYRDTLFRSRTEARWAVFFDALSIPWQYEPEGLERNGLRYLPDFLIILADGKQRCVFEVKSTLGATVRDRVKMDGVLWDAETGCLVDGVPRVLIADGNPVDVLQDGDGLETLGDQSYRFCLCAYCGAVGCEFNGMNDRIPCCSHIGKRHRGHSPVDEQRITDAVAASRLYSFWSPPVL